MDSINVHHQKNAATIAALRRQYADTTSKATYSRRLRNSVIATEDRLADSIKVEGLRVGWVTIAYNVASSKFRLLDPEAEPDSQVSKGSFLSHGIRAQYSFYNWQPAANRSYYAALSATVSLKDNLSSLTKVDVTDTRTLAGAPLGRESVEKYAAYAGKYADALWTLTIAADHYRFLFTDDKAALHFFPEYVLQQGGLSAANAGVGFLVAFRSKDKAVLSSELFVQLKDVLDQNESDLSWYNRNSIGVRVSVPVNFLH